MSIITLCTTYAKMQGVAAQSYLEFSRSDPPERLYGLVLISAVNSALNRSTPLGRFCNEACSSFSVCRGVVHLLPVQWLSEVLHSMCFKLEQTT
jgi:hypothetical protein